MLDTLKKPLKLRQSTSPRSILSWFLDSGDSSFLFSSTGGLQAPLIQVRIPKRGITFAINIYQIARKTTKNNKSERKPIKNSFVNRQASLFSIYTPGKREDS